MRSSHHIDIEVRTDEQGRKVIDAIGDVDLQTAPILRHRIETVAQPGEDLVIDLRRVAFMDSPGLGMLIHCDRVQRQRGGHLVLKGPTGPVRELFDIVRLGSVVEIE
jgi:anti-sigma B factor antagonist